MKKKLLIGGLLLLSIASAWAHGDEDHGAAQTAEIVTADKPNRLPDGRVFIPKAVQRRLEIRTLLAEEKTVARTLELNGHVVMDPDSGGRVQAMQSGRIESAARGLPHVGAKVRKGDVLAYVQPAISSLERASAQAEQREVQARLQLAEKQLVRLKSLSGTVPGKEIDAAEAEIAALQGRYQALATGNAREALRAPVSGVIAANNVVNGQVVEAREVLFEIVDPARMMIEALAYDPQLVRGLSGASLAGSKTRLVYLGGAASLREGALPLLFRVQGADMPLALGQTVKVIAQTDQTLTGVPLPTSAIVKNSANENVVWVHERAEIFRPVAVQVSSVDGAQVVAQGLKSGQRIVISSAALINQIR